MNFYNILYLSVVWIISRFGHVVNGVTIFGLRVPEAVRNGTESGVVLDCLYTLHSKETTIDSGLVVKWFFNKSPKPVYQWIHTQKPQDAGILKGRLKLDYKASNDTATMYRALYILKPTTELSGEYKCLVSTYHGEDFMMKKMIVFVPEKRMEFFHLKQDIDKINISCRVEGVYPEPKISLYKDPDRGERYPLEKATVNAVKSKSGAYDVITSVVFVEDKLESPTVFDCKLHIPGSMYTKTKTILYFPGAVESLSSVRNTAVQRTVYRTYHLYAPTIIGLISAINRINNEWMIH